MSTPLLTAGIKPPSCLGKLEANGPSSRLILRGAPLPSPASSPARGKQGPNLIPFQLHPLRVLPHSPASWAGVGPGHSRAARPGQHGEGVIPAPFFRDKNIKHGVLVAAQAQCGTPCRRMAASTRCPLGPIQHRSWPQSRLVPSEALTHDKPRLSPSGEEQLLSPPPFSCRQGETEAWGGERRHRARCLS